LFIPFLFLKNMFHIDDGSHYFLVCYSCKILNDGKTIPKWNLLKQCMSIKNVFKIVSNAYSNCEIQYVEHKVLVCVLKNWRSFMVRPLIYRTIHMYRFSIKYGALQK
jgi:hypothetical protein